MNIQDVKFGIEIELTGVCRQLAAEMCAEYWGTTAEYYGFNKNIGYQTWGTYDPEGRLWKFSFDSSIRTGDAENERLWDDNYKCEMITPVLSFSDLKHVKNIVKKLVWAGAIVNETTGLHVHCDGGRALTAEKVRNLLNMVKAHDELIRKAIQFDCARNRWAQSTPSELIKLINKEKPVSLERLSVIYYSFFHESRGAEEHYPMSRYYGVNLHSLFQGKGIEFRWFNSTLDTDKIEAYVTFCCALVASAVNQSRASAKPTKGGQGENDKYALRCWMIKLGLKGKEYATTRKVLEAPLEGDSTRSTAIQ